MQIVLFKDEDVLKVIDNVVDIKIEGKNIVWHDGSIRDVKIDYIIVDDEVEIGDIINDEIMALNQREKFVKPPIVDETAELKKQQTDLIFELMMKGVL